MGTEPSMMQFDDRDSWGLIPRYVADLFEGVKERQELFLVKVTTSFIEIYNEKVYDLLAPDVGRDRRELLIRENNEGIVVRTTQIGLLNLSNNQNVLSVTGSGKNTC